MQTAGHFIVALLLLQTLGGANSGIQINDTGKVFPIFNRPTEFDGGPALGNMLNFHYFPGVILYNAGYYHYAEPELRFVLERIQALDANPRKAEYVSKAYYLRGMIYLHHAVGIGHHALAKADLEAAIKWNPANHYAYLELAEVYSSLGFIDPALSILKSLSNLSPAPEIAERAQKKTEELTKLQRPVKPGPEVHQN